MISLLDVHLQPFVMGKVTMWLVSCRHDRRLSDRSCRTRNRFMCVAITPQSLPRGNADEISKTESIQMKLASLCVIVAATAMCPLAEL
jgi:hypothetical protein